MNSSEGNQDGLTGRVLRKGDAGWNDSRRGFAARCDYDGHEPRAVVFARSPQDVMNAVKWARSNGIGLRVRSGRHNYEGYSSLIKDGIVLDVSGLDEFSVSERRSEVIVGAGVDMATLAEKLAGFGLGLPLATGPTVGLAGLVQGGGFGVTSRRYGLMCDNLTGVEIVDAQGDLLEANSATHLGLFWALRGGGGGNFGVVTRLKLTPYQVGDVGVFNITWSWSDFEIVVDRWQRWNWEAVPAITSLLTLHVDGTVRLEGQYTPDPSDLPSMGEVLATMLSGPVPLTNQMVVVPEIVSARMLFGGDPMTLGSATRSHGQSQLFKSTSAIATSFIPKEGIRLMKELLEAVPPLSAPASQPSMIQLLGGGGKPSELSSDATAVFYRDAKVIVQYNGYWTASEDAQPTIDWVVNMRKAMLPYAKAAYVNYQDEALGEDWLMQYYGANVARLRGIKKAYDPDNFFNFPQSIPPA